MTDGMAWRFLLEKVRGLRLPVGEYAVFGSGPMLAHGLVEKAGDTDILARGAAWEKAKGLGKVEMGRHDPFVRLGGNVEIFGGWVGMDVDVIIGRAVLVEGVQFARLEDVLAFKRLLRRTKDIEHIRLIEKHLAKV